MPIQLDIYKHNVVYELNLLIFFYIYSNIYAVYQIQVSKSEINTTTFKTCIYIYFLTEK